jgi:hypothetical protein
MSAVVGLAQPRSRVLACYTLVAPLTLVAIGETGANHNHLLETLLAYSISAGILVGLLLRQKPSIASWPRIFGGHMAITALLATQLWLIAQPQAWYGSELNPASRDGPKRLVTFMRSKPGEILADDPGLLLLAGKPVRYDDASTMGPAAEIGKWSPRGLLDDIANRRFSAIMIPVDLDVETADPAGRWPPEVLAEIKRYYRLLYRGDVATYVPR